MSKAEFVTIKNVQAKCVLVSNPRSKRVRITVLPTGVVRITKPIRVSTAQAIVFAEQNAAWIMKNYQKIEGSIVSPEESEVHFKENKEKAREILIKKIERWNGVYGFEYKDVRVKRQRTRWGSCSSKKNLNFNYRLIFLPERLIDYVVVHELCHLKEMNHSERFWGLVSIALPNYRELRAELRGYL